MDSIITIRDDWDDWGMELNLEAIADDAGVRKCEKFYDTKKKKTERTYYTDLPLKNAKKMIDLILKYGSENDFEKVERHFQANAKLYKYWREKLDK